MPLKLSERKFKEIAHFVFAIINVYHSDVCFEYTNLIKNSQTCAYSLEKVIPLIALLAAQRNRGYINPKFMMSKSRL